MRQGETQRQPTASGTVIRLEACLKERDELWGETNQEVQAEPGFPSARLPGGSVFWGWALCRHAGHTCEADGEKTPQDWTVSS